jgi:hypothetical protein
LEMAPGHADCVASGSRPGEFVEALAGLESRLQAHILEFLPCPCLIPT